MIDIFNELREYVASDTEGPFVISVKSTSSLADQYRKTLLPLEFSEQRGAGLSMFICDKENAERVTYFKYGPFGYNGMTLREEMDEGERIAREEIQDNAQKD